MPYSAPGKDVVGRVDTLYLQKLSREKTPIRLNQTNSFREERN